MMGMINELRGIKSKLEETNAILETDIKTALGELERQRTEYHQKVEAIKGMF
jgi:hypothetical protein